MIRHAGVFTGKEILALARDKAIRLKTLYIDELKRTYYRLKELRREYLREVKTETRNVLFCICVFVKMYRIFIILNVYKTSLSLFLLMLLIVTSFFSVDAAKFIFTIL